MEIQAVETHVAAFAIIPYCGFSVPSVDTIAVLIRVLSGSDTRRRNELGRRIT
jgi:hypothetical protein